MDQWNFGLTDFCCTYVVQYCNTGVIWKSFKSRYNKQIYPNTGHRTQGSWGGRCPQQYQTWPWRRRRCGASGHSACCQGLTVASASGGSCCRCWRQPSAPSGLAGVGICWLGRLFVCWYIKSVYSNISLPLCLSWHSIVFYLIFFIYLDLIEVFTFFSIIVFICFFTYLDGLVFPSVFYSSILFFHFDTFLPLFWLGGIFYSATFFVLVLDVIFYFLLT